MGKHGRVCYWHGQEVDVRLEHWLCWWRRERKYDHSEELLLCMQTNRTLQKFTNLPIVCAIKPALHRPPGGFNYISVTIKRNRKSALSGPPALQSIQQRSTNNSTNSKKERSNTTINTTNKTFWPLLILEQRKLHQPQMHVHTRM